MLSYRGLLIAAAVAGIGLGVAGCSGSSSAAALTTSAAPTTSASAAPHKGGPHGVAGTISAENGSTWTVTTKAGKQVTVDIISTTKFGTTQAPATESQFAVGAMVRVDGTVNGTTVTATRIAVPAPKPPTSSSAAAPTTTS